MNRVVSACLSGLLVSCTASLAFAIPVARDGTPLVPIILADDCTPAERSAAEMLALYLGSSVGGKFAVVPERVHEIGAAAIHVGPTAFARSVGADPRALGPEEWILRTESGNLVLAGGRPRGSLYAVLRFLEDVVGVRWWTPRDESVPGRPNLRTGPLNRRGSPAFAYRDFFGLDGPPIFRLHLGLNGSESGLAEEWGGRKSFGMHGVHSFEILVPPDEAFDVHPEFFSERAGFRSADRSQLCLSQEALVPFVATRLLTIVRDVRGRAREAGLPPPDLFDVSPNDWDGRCACARCRAAAEREESESGPLLEFVNRVAEFVRAEEPEVQITTLAYTWTFDPPVKVRPATGVIVRVSGYGIRDQIRSVLHPSNARYREALGRWASVARDLWVWDYVVTYHDRFALPLPNLRTFGPDLRWYREIGVDGLFIQFGSPFGGDLHDLKAWVLGKLCQDPSLSTASLVRIFTDGYYGSAGRHIRRYIRFTETAADALAATIRADAEPSDFRWLEVEWLHRASESFDKAEKSVRHDPILVNRVRDARAALDWAVLRFSAGDAFDRSAVAGRLRRTWIRRAETRLTPERRAEALAWIEESLPPTSR